MESMVEYPTARCVPICTIIVAGGLLAIALEVGTGGAPTPDYYTRRGPMGYALACYEPGPSMEAPLASRTPVEDLSHVRTVLKPSITDLARALGVSRQAIYDWQNGKPIGSVNATHLADLARAADLFAVEGLTSPSQLLRRPINGKRSFLDVVREGGSAEEAIRELVIRVRRELDQRQRLGARLANRKRPATVAEDYSSPMLDEAG